MEVISGSRKGLFTLMMSQRQSARCRTTSFLSGQKGHIDSLLSFNLLVKRFDLNKSG